MMRKEKDSDRLIAAASQYGKEKEFWLDKLSGEFSTDFFPYDHTGTIDERCMETESFDITGPFFARLMKVSGSSAVRLHMILAAGVVALIARYTGSSDILLGTPIYKQDIEGEFTNTVLVLRNRLTEAMTFKELLIQFRQTIGEAVENANYPIETWLCN